jgi:propanol-preferring alcohol dehydrogenase
VPLFDVVANCITIRGSFVGNREDMVETLAFAAEGRVKADIELEPLSAINSIFDRLKEGKVAGRVVIDFIDAPEARAAKPSTAENREAVPV